jgi:pyrroline-5-carboxylate reductase
VAATADNGAAIRGAGLVILAVKPQVMREVVEPLAGAIRTAGAVVLSIAAGIRLRDIESWCGAGVPVIRAMPNRPALVGAGAAGLYAPPAVGARARALAEQAMQAVGRAFWVADESLLDVVTALSGSGPAYYFLLGELMAEAGERLGLDTATARSLAVATLAGAGALAAAGDGDLARMREQVTSKGGTTAAALGAFGRADLRGIVLRALTAAADRSRELAGVAPVMHTAAQAAAHDDPPPGT